MRSKIRYRLPGAVMAAIAALVGASGFSLAAVTDRGTYQKLSASGYFMNPCTKEFVEYRGYVRLREASAYTRAGGFRHAVRETSQELKGYGTTTGDRYTIRIGPGRSIIKAKGSGDQGGQAMKIEGMNVIHLGPGAPRGWLVNDAALLTVTNGLGFPAMVQFIVGDKSCD